MRRSLLLNVKNSFLLSFLRNYYAMGYPLDLCEKATATPAKLPSLHTKGDHNISFPVLVKVLPEKVLQVLGYRSPRT